MLRHHKRVFTTERTERTEGMRRKRFSEPQDCFSPLPLCALCALWGEYRDHRASRPRLARRHPVLPRNRGSAPLRRSGVLTHRLRRAAHDFLQRGRQRHGRSHSLRRTARRGGELRSPRRSSQRNRQSYRDFTRRAMEAGVRLFRLPARKTCDLLRPSRRPAHRMVPGLCF